MTWSRQSPRTSRFLVDLFSFLRIVVVVFIFVVELIELVFDLLLGVVGGRDRLPLKLYIDTDVAELRVEELEELVHVVARPLVEHLCKELVEVAVVEAPLHFLDLFFRKRFENVLPQRLRVALLNRVLRREANLPNCTFSENDLHPSSPTPAQDLKSAPTNTQSHHPVSTAALCDSLGAMHEAASSSGSPSEQAAQNAPQRSRQRARRASWTALAVYLASSPAQAQATPPVRVPIEGGVERDAPAAAASTPRPRVPDKGQAVGPPTTETPLTDQGSPRRSGVDLQTAPPPPTHVVYVQYGVALAAEVVTAAGPICSNVGLPCILGPGGGLAARVGLRGAGPLYLGGAYELSKQDSNKLYRLAILQQGRAEARYYFVSGRMTDPYVTLGLGVAAYGNEWGVDTWGPTLAAGFGLETQMTRRTVVGVALAYRLVYFQTFRDTTGAPREAGITQLFGLEFTLEQREPVTAEGAAPPPR